MKTITVWTAYTSTNEMSSDGELIGVFLTKGQAEEAAVGRGWWGGMGNVRERKAILCDGRNPDEDVYLLDKEYTNLIPIGEDLPARRKELKKKALEKLSPEELDVLGLGVYND
jgi:hypothetical protein